MRVDVRLLGATHVDLPSWARLGRFREDLLDRLAFDVITVPPLRERPGDIALLAQRFGEAMATELDRDYFAGFAPQSRAQLCAHDWPGNVRELRSAVERAVYRLERAEQPVREIELDPFASPALAAAPYSQKRAAERLALGDHQYRGLLRKYRLPGGAG